MGGLGEGLGESEMRARGGSHVTRGWAQHPEYVPGVLRHPPWPPGPSPWPPPCGPCRRLLLLRLRERGPVIAGAGAGPGCQSVGPRRVSLRHVSNGRSSGCGARGRPGNKFNVKAAGGIRRRSRRHCTAPQSQASTRSHSPGRLGNPPPESGAAAAAARADGPSWDAASTESASERPR